MAKIDLFDTLVRFLAVKPLPLEKLDFESAQRLIKKDKAGAVTFIGEHGYFEEALEGMVNRVSALGVKTGTVYINIKGQGCTDRIKKKLMELSMSVGNVIIFGSPEKWPAMGADIRFTSNDDIFEDNHQRFFICHTPSFSIALVARHEQHDGVVKTEAIITNDSDAVNILAVTVGTKIYPLV